MTIRSNSKVYFRMCSYRAHSSVKNLLKITFEFTRKLLPNLLENYFGIYSKFTSKFTRKLLGNLLENYLGIYSKILGNLLENSLEIYSKLYVRRLCYVMVHSPKGNFCNTSVPYMRSRTCQ